MRSFADFIAGSLQTLHDEFPQAYFLLCARLAGREVLLTIDGEAVPLAFELRSTHILPGPRQPQVSLQTSRQAILDVIDANLTLEQAVYEGAIVLQGAIPELVAFHDALLTYVRGAVRCPTFPSWLERFRRNPSNPLDQGGQEGQSSLYNP